MTCPQFVQITEHYAAAEHAYKSKASTMTTPAMHKLCTCYAYRLHEGQAKCFATSAMHSLKYGYQALLVCSMVFYPAKDAMCWVVLYLPVLDICPHLSAGTKMNPETHIDHSMCGAGFTHLMQVVRSGHISSTGRVISTSQSMASTENGKFATYIQARHGSHTQVSQ